VVGMIGFFIPPTEDHVQFLSCHEVEKLYLTDDSMQQRRSLDANPPVGSNPTLSAISDFS